MSPAGELCSLLPGSGGNWWWISICLSRRWWTLVVLAVDPKKPARAIGQERSWAGRTYQWARERSRCRRLSQTETIPYILFCPMRMMIGMFRPLFLFFNGIPYVCFIVSVFFEMRAGCLRVDLANLFFADPQFPLPQCRHICGQRSVFILHATRCICEQTWHHEKWSGLIVRRLCTESLNLYIQSYCCIYMYDGRWWAWGISAVACLL